MQEEQVEVGMAVVKELEEVLMVMVGVVEVALVLAVAVAVAVPMVQEVHMGVDTEEAVGVERVVAMVATPLKISSLYQMRLLL